MLRVKATSSATGSYSSYTGIDPDTSELLDGWSKRTDGTTDDETFLRRVHLDIIGLLPTVDEVKQFVADQNPQKRAAKIDQLLTRDETSRRRLRTRAASRAGPSHRCHRRR